MSVVCSLLATCKTHEVNPGEYLNDVIAKMQYMQKAAYDELLQQLPHKWKTDKRLTRVATPIERIATLDIYFTTGTLAYG